MNINQTYALKLKDGQTVVGVPYLIQNGVIHLYTHVNGEFMTARVLENQIEEAI